MKIEMVRVDAITPYDRNARTHSDAQVLQIAASIREFGFTNPVLLDADYELIAGEGRLRAAKLIGLEKVPCIRLGHLTEAQKRAYVLADNKIALNAGWDETRLAAELDALRAMDFDLAPIGFTDEEITNLLDYGATGALDAMPDLPDGDKEPFQQKTFTLHDKQVRIVDDALAIARDDPGIDTGLNGNMNGNAIALICEQWLARRTSL